MMTAPRPTPERSARLERRRRAERRFKFYCQAMISLAVAFVFVILGLIGSKALTAFSRYYLDLRVAEVPLDASDPTAIAPSTATLDAIIETVEVDLRARLELGTATSDDPAIARDVFARLAAISAVKKGLETPSDVSETFALRIPVDNKLDLYLKNRHIERDATTIEVTTRLVHGADDRYFIAFSEPAIARQLAYAATGQSSETLLTLGSSWFQLVGLDQDRLEVRRLIGPDADVEVEWATLKILTLAVQSSNRKLTNRQIALGEQLVAQGVIKRGFNRELFTNADSTLPEIAGAAAAIIGTVLTILMTSFFALPIGILAAIYLEELAPSNRLTNLLEININNLAAIPSIIFGLLGAAVFLNAFGMPRSVPLVGGLVLGLLVLPTVIISSRAALGAVPYDLRAGALALGASRMQTVFDHVLPVAGPGIVTGAILAMARAIGETAPLLLIGMVAFVHEIPGRIDDEATVLPVLIYKWFSGAERAWDPMTAAVVIILIGLLISLNLIAVFIRWQLDKTWTRL